MNDPEPTSLRLGFSPCPNDTFMFHALVTERVPTEGVNWDVQIEDIERLNQLAFEEAIDVTKISFHAFGNLRDRYALLASGAALGRGCGPLLVMRETAVKSGLDKARIAIPGWNTSATLLLRMFAPELRREQFVEMEFDEILRATAQNEVDAGLIIHESRFTYQQYGLTSLVDLGDWWEAESGRPIPLGGIVVHRKIGGEMMRRIETALRASVEHARAHPEESREYIQQHAQEIDPDVQDSHIALYVNDFSVDLREEGTNAVKAFFELATERGLLTPFDGPIMAAEIP